MSYLHFILLLICLYAHSRDTPNNYAVKQGRQIDAGLQVLRMENLPWDYVEM